MLISSSVVNAIADTIHQKIIIDTIKASSKDSMDLLNKMDGFYNNAWTKLIIFITIAFTIVGLIVPALIQWYQKNQLTLSEEKLKAEIKAEISKAIADTQKIIKENLDKEVKQLHAEIRGFGYQFQADLYRESEKYPNAVRDYVRAIKEYLESENIPRAFSILDRLKSTIKKCSKNILDTTLKSTIKSIPEAIEDIKNTNQNEPLNKALSEIIVLYQKLPSE